MDKPPLLHKFPVSMRILTFGLIIISSVILVLIFGIVIAVPFFGPDVMKDLAIMDTSKNEHIIAMAKYFQIVSQFGMFLIPTVLFAYLDGRHIGGYLKINIRPAFNTMIFAILAMLVATPLINYLSELNQQMSLPSSMKYIEQWMRQSEDKAGLMTENFLNVSTIGGFAINLLMIAVIPAIGEEFLFRGVLQKLFQQWTRNIHFAVIFSAFLFSAIHMQFYGFIPRFLMGVMLGYAFVWTGSLWIPILIHFVNNSAAVIASWVYSDKAGENAIDTLGTGNAALVPVLISTVLTGSFIFLIYYTGKKKFRAAEQNI
jgi:uncharacterized protein